MKLTNPETHLLRELHILASPVVLLVGLFTGRFVEPQIGLSMLLQSFAILFVVGFLAFWILGLVRSRTLGVRGSIWSGIVSATVNMVAVGTVYLALRIWVRQWPFNLESAAPDDITGADGEPFLIAVMLTALATFIWVLGIFAVGATPARQPKSKQVPE